jgi:hypothetical protein
MAVGLHRSEPPVAVLRDDDLWITGLAVTRRLVGEEHDVSRPDGNEIPCAKARSGPGDCVARSLEDSRRAVLVACAFGLRVNLAPLAGFG